MQALEKEISLFIGNKTVYLTIQESTINSTLLQLIQTVIAQHGYSSKIFLYHIPLSPLSKLHFINTNTTLSSLLQEYPHLALTYNNTQFIEEISYNHIQSQQNSEFIFLIIQASQNNVFYHQTYKITHDCKMIFVISIAANYGRYSYLQYYDFAIPLNLFETQQTIENTLKKFCILGNYLIITSQTQQHFNYYKSVKNVSLIDQSKYLTLELVQKKQYLIINRQAQWCSVRSILSLIWPAQLQLISNDNKHFKMNEIDPISHKDIFKLGILPSKKQDLQQALLLSIFIGQTSHYLCFIQQSHILHLFSLHPPYQLINSVFLQSRPSVYMDQQIPVLMNENLVMFNITISLIILKYYQLPLGKLLYTKHFNWYNKLYGPIKCDTLDILAVPLINRSKTRIFHINQPNNYMEIDCPFEEWDFWVAKDGLNNFSNKTGLFAILKHFKSRLEIYNLKTKMLLNVIQLNQMGESKGVKSVHFNKTDNILIINFKQNWIQYDFENGKIIRKEKNTKSYEQLCYTPTGKIMLFTEKTFSFLNNKNKEPIRADHTLLLQGEQFFSKDTQHKYWNYESIYILQTETQNEIYQPFLQFSSNS